MDVRASDPALNPCHWEPEFYAAASSCAHGWAAYRGSGPPRPKPVRHCNFCGSTKHLMRGCTMGSSLAREHQFLRCGTALPMPCFVRRFVVPLHRARADFDLDDLREGRIDLAARLVVAALVCSQRLRHNTQLWLPLLGDAEPLTLCVTGGLVR